MQCRDPVGAMQRLTVLSDSTEQSVGNRMDPLNQVLRSCKKHFVYSVNSQPELCILIRFSRSDGNTAVMQCDPGCLLWSRDPQISDRAALGMDAGFSVPFP